MSKKVLGILHFGNKTVEVNISDRVTPEKLEKFGPVGGGPIAPSLLEAEAKWRRGIVDAIGDKLKKHLYPFCLVCVTDPGDEVESIYIEK